MRQPKLIAGQKNVILTKLKAGHAEGASKPKRIKKQQAQFENNPTVCIVLRKAA